MTVSREKIWRIDYLGPLAHKFKTHEERKPTIRHVEQSMLADGTIGDLSQCFSKNEAIRLAKVYSRWYGEEFRAYKGPDI